MELIEILQEVEKISLDGIWKLKNIKKSLEIDAQVPGTVFEALLENNTIVNPFYGKNEHEVKWVYESDWIYEIEFNVELGFLEHENIILRFNGLDTIAEVNLNGEKLGSANNMFVRYDFDVKSKLKETNNKLMVKFNSPTLEAQGDIKKHGYKLNTGYAAIPGVPYLRKAQYSFGWDWGPQLPDIGIWKPVKLIGHDGIKISSVYCYSKFITDKETIKTKYIDKISTIDTNLVKLFIEVDVYSNLKNLSNQNYNLKIKLKTPDDEVFNKEIPLSNKKETIKFDIENPILWWTHDLGTPNLYQVEVTILKDKVLERITQHIGLRDIQLIRKPDKWGETFYFLLNGIPLFAKGANWIPVDSFIPRGKKLGLYSMNLNYAKRANMNMIRVWGGGIYEDESFYNLCDELGLLVWQDFPFACALYPYNADFIENVEREAIQNIKRLRSHPSLALWCGNNEIESLWKWEINRTGIAEDNTKRLNFLINFYLRIFEELLPNLINKFDPTRSYWPSSPSNGLINENLAGRSSNNPNSGDSHYWGVWHGNMPFSAYRKFDSRFMSEFGYESFPSLKTIENFCPVDQFDFNSPSMENHQKNSAGNQKIMDYMDKRFTIPQEFEHQIILSQITQAEAIEYGVEHWRRNRNEFHCMGSLYWQLNDCWPVASWSSLDYFGRWKALHYFAKRFYNPIFANVKEDSDKVEFWVINDLKDSQNINLQWKIIKSNGTILIKGEYDSLVLPCSSLKLGAVDVSDINKTEIHRQNNIIFYKLKRNNKNAETISHGFRLFGEPKLFNLMDPEIESFLEENKEEQKNNNYFKLTLRVKNIALYVFIDSKIVDFVASDNFFSMEPHENRIIDIEIIKILNDGKASSKQDIIDSFKIKSLFDLLN